MKDEFGDEIVIENDPIDKVWVLFRDAWDGETMDMQFTPKQARKFARKIKRAAKEAERA